MVNLSVLGNRLRKAREAKGLSLTDVARLTKIMDFSLLGQYERGEKNPPVQKLIHLANLYDVTLDWLAGRTDNPRAHIYTTEQVRDEVAHYGIPDDDPRVLEIARELREITSDPDILENILTYARFIAEQERRHPGPHKPGPVRIKNGLLSGQDQNSVKNSKKKQN